LTYEPLLIVSEYSVAVHAIVNEDAKLAARVDRQLVAPRPLTVTVTSRRSSAPRA
jgi:hypothetical protein